MGTLVFLPWATLASGCRIGEFELKPVLVDREIRERSSLQSRSGASSQRQHESRRPF
jgi:hypothetical protein